MEFSLQNVNNPASRITDFSIGGILTQLGIINLAFFIVGLVFMASMIAAGVGYIGASGSPEGINKAPSRLVNSLVGLLITVGSFIIVRLVSATIGLNDILPF